MVDKDFMNRPAVDKRDSEPDRFDNHEEIEQLFDQAFLKCKTPEFESFLNSVYNWWEEKGFLTRPQYHAVRRAAE